MNNVIAYVFYFKNILSRKEEEGEIGENVVSGEKYT
jgi:hypothetical protein